MYGSADGDKARSVEELQRIVLESVLPWPQIDVDNLLNLSAVHHVLQCPDDSEFVNAIWEELEDRRTDTEEEQEGKQEVESVKLPPTKLQIDALAWQKKIVKDAGLVHVHLLNNMRVIQGLVREEAPKSF